MRKTGFRVCEVNATPGTGARVMSAAAETVGSNPIDPILPGSCGASGPRVTNREPSTLSRSSTTAVIPLPSNPCSFGDVINTSKFLAEIATPANSSICDTASSPARGIFRTTGSAFAAGRVSNLAALWIIRSLATKA